MPNRRLSSRENVTIAAMPRQFSGFRPVAVLRTGVLGATGVESAEAVRGLAAQIHPALIIAVDALASRRMGRLCNTIQFSDTGIIPGSGVGNHRAALNRETLGVPVVAIGVPMVVYAAVIARDALTLLLQDMGIQEEQHEQAMDALVDKVTRQGLGELVVTPREVDELVGKVGQVIARGINLALQPRLTEEEIELLTHDSL